MGASYSEVESPYKYLERLCGEEKISVDDAFWDDFLSSAAIIPQATYSPNKEYRWHEESLQLLLGNNLITSNLSTLTEVTFIRLQKVFASREDDENYKQNLTCLCNALFILRITCKYFIERMPEDAVMQHLHIVGDDDHESFFRGLFSLLTQFMFTIPVNNITYFSHVEILTLIIVLLSSRLFESAPNKPSKLQTMFAGQSMQECHSIIRFLLDNYINRIPLTWESPNESGSIVFAVASGMWSVISYPFSFGRTSSPAPLPCRFVSPLAHRSLLLMEILASIVIEHDEPSNFCLALSKAVDIVSSISETPKESELPQGRIVVSFRSLYDVLCCELEQEETTLFLYMLLQHNETFKTWLLSRTDVDAFILPLLKVIYKCGDGNTGHCVQHVYMSLIVLLQLTEDAVLCSVLTEMQLEVVDFFTETKLRNVTLSCLCVLVLLRLIKKNIASVKDRYLFNNTLAVLANISCTGCVLNEPAAQSFVSVVLLLRKKQLALSKRSSTESSSQEEKDEKVENECTENEAVIVEEILRMLLEISVNILAHSLVDNLHLIHGFLYQRQILTDLATHHNLQDILLILESVFSHFSTHIITAKSKGFPLVNSDQVMACLLESARRIPSTIIMPLPHLRFKYVEEEDSFKFFVPYIWSLVYSHCNINWDINMIALFQYS